MPRFSYDAFDAAGLEVAGIVEAPSEPEALDKIRALGQIPYRTSLDVGQGREVANFNLNLSRNMDLRARASMTKELAILLQADVPIDGALAAISGNASNGMIGDVITDVLENVLAGQSLSDAVSSQPHAFDQGYVALVRAGETSGALPQVLDDMARNLERQLAVRTRLRSALVYPAILLFMAAISVLIIVTILVPSVEPLFGSERAMPPGLRALSLFGNAPAGLWPVLAAIGIMSLIALRWLLKIDVLATARDRLTLHLPFAGSIIARRETARFARALAVLMTAGVPLLEAMGVAGAAVRNRMFADELAERAEQIADGTGLPEAIAGSEIVPEMAKHLLRIGEESGHVDQMLLHIATVYEDSVITDSERLMTVVTPLITITIGLLVGGLIFSVMGALTSLNEAVL